MDVRKVTDPAFTPPDPKRDPEARMIEELDGQSLAVKLELEELERTRAALHGKLDAYAHLRSRIVNRMLRLSEDRRA